MKDRLPPCRCHTHHVTLAHSRTKNTGAQVQCSFEPLSFFQIKYTAVLWIYFPNSFTHERWFIIRLYLCTMQRRSIISYTAFHKYFLPSKAVICVRWGYFRETPNFCHHISLNDYFNASVFCERYGYATNCFLWFVFVVLQPPWNVISNFSFETSPRSHYWALKLQMLSADVKRIPKCDKLLTISPLASERKAKNGCSQPIFAACRFRGQPTLYTTAQKTTHSLQNPFGLREICRQPAHPSSALISSHKQFCSCSTMLSERRC